jgi:hypothetical protein
MTLRRNSRVPYEKRVRKAQLIADDRREACIQAKRSFSFETVMSHPSKLEVLLRAKQAGFFVQLFFVGTEDPQISIHRVALRVAQGATTYQQTESGRAGFERWGNSAPPFSAPIELLSSTTQPPESIWSWSSFGKLLRTGQRSDRSRRYQVGSDIM